MGAKRRNRGIMGAAMLLGAILVALDHSQYRRSSPPPGVGESEPQVEAGGYGSAAEDSDTSFTSATGAETGGYGAAAGDAQTVIGPGAETGGYGAAGGEHADETGAGAAATTAPDEDMSGDMEEYYKRLQIDAETDDAR